MADHSSGPRIFQAASRPTSAEPSPPCPQTRPGERGQTWAKTWDTEGFGALLMHHAADLPLLAPHCASPISRHVWLFGSTRIGWYTHAVDVEVNLPAILVGWLFSMLYHYTHGACRVWWMYAIQNMPTADRGCFYQMLSIVSLLP